MKYYNEIMEISYVKWWYFNTLAKIELVICNEL